MDDPSDESDDDHRGIPRDERGVPIFLILPPALRAKYEAQMEVCRKGWEAGETLAMAEATTLTFAHRQPIPAWLEAAIVKVAMARRPAAQARRHAELDKHFTRYRAVRSLKAAGLTWDKAYARAAKRLANTFAAGTDDTMAASYKEVLREIKAGRTGQYFMLRDRRYRRNGKPDPRPGWKPPTNK
jgi:hypothetical protein